MRETPPPAYPAVAGFEGGAVPPAGEWFADAPRDEIFREDCEASRPRGRGAISVDYLLEKGWSLPEIGRRLPLVVQAWQRARDEAMTRAITAPVVAGMIAAAPLFSALLAVWSLADLTLRGA